MEQQPHKGSKEVKKTQPAGNNDSTDDAPKKRRKKHVKNACFNCHLAKRACEEVRPCGRCKIRNLKCNPLHPPSTPVSITPLRHPTQMPQPQQQHQPQQPPSQQQQQQQQPPHNPISFSSIPHVMPHSYTMPTTISVLSSSLPIPSPPPYHSISLNSSLALAFSPTSISTHSPLSSSGSDIINPLSYSSSFTSSSTFSSSLSSSPPYIMHPLGSSAPSVITSFFDNRASTYQIENSITENNNTNPLSSSNGFISGLFNLNFGDDDIKNEDIHISSDIISKDMESTIDGLISSSGDFNFIHDSPIIVSPNDETNRTTSQLDNELVQSYLDNFDYNSMPYSLWDIQTQQLVACNTAFQTLIGYNMSEMSTNFHCTYMVPPRYHNHLEIFWNFMKSVAAIDRTVEMNMCLQEKNGNEKCVKTLIAPISGNNKICMMKHIEVNRYGDKWSIGEFTHFQTTQVSAPQDCKLSFAEIGKVWDFMRTKGNWV